VFVAATIAVRGDTIPVWRWLNPDEAELMAQGRAARESLLPYTTWTMGTTGPFWPMFLALLGAVGLPLTLAFAHFLAAALVGGMGYVVWVLMRRTLGPLWGSFAAILWWLPLAVMYPIGGLPDFGALSTELLPCVLILAAALVPLHRLAARPWLFIVPGVLSGLAVGAKYQSAPVVLALVCAQLLAAKLSRKRLVVSMVWWASAAAAPIVVVVVAMALSPSVSYELFLDNVRFLGSYGSGAGLLTRAENLLRLLATQKYLILVAIFLARLGFLSSRRILVARAVLVAGGLAAVGAGGMGFGHYLWFLYVALALAACLPVAEGSQLVPSQRLRQVTLPLAAGAAVALLLLGATTGRLSSPSLSSVGDAFRSSSVPQDAAVSAACPAGSHVLVWGWAAELYVYYSWENTVPFMNTLGLRSTPENLSAARPIVSKGIANANCVVDASGSPFFGANKAAGLELVYPEFTAVLSKEFTKRQGVINCPSCTLYVRN
jgi:hypothetical protein